MSESATILYSNQDCHYCQRVRFVLNEKRIPFEMRFMDEKSLSDLEEINQYGEIPVLCDRDLTLFFPNIIIEYLEERYPHPPLMPVVPIERAQLRTYIQQVEQAWAIRLDKLMNPGFSRTHVVKRVRQELQDSVLSVAPIFANKPFYMSSTMTLADCCVLPILWRLPLYGVELPRTRQTRAMLDYIDRIADTTSFQESLTDVERQLMGAV